MTELFLLSFPVRPLLSGETMDSSDEEEVRTFVQVVSEKYNPENFPYGQGVVVLASPTGSPVKGERRQPPLPPLRCVFI